MTKRCRQGSRIVACGTSRHCTYPINPLFQSYGVHRLSIWTTFVHDFSDFSLRWEHGKANKRLEWKGYAAASTPSVSILVWDRGRSSNIHPLSVFSMDVPECGGCIKFPCKNYSSTKFLRGQRTTYKRLVGTFCRVNDGPVQLFRSRGRVPSFLLGYHFRCRTNRQRPIVSVP